MPRVKEIDPSSPLGLALRFQVPARRKRRRPRRPRAQRHPLTIERQFQSETRAVVAETEDIIRVSVLPELPDLERRAEAGDPLWPAAVAALFAAAGLQWEERSEQASAIAEVAAIEVSTFNRVQVGKQLTSIVGVDLMPEGRRTASLIESFVGEINPRIKDLGAQQIAEIRGIVSRGMQAGRRAADVGKEIQERFAINERRAKFIARNELSTLNAQFTKDRQTELGIGQYIWRTSRDERVRTTHARLEGTLQSWDDPPPVGGGRHLHPGEDFNCRCTAEPAIPGVTIPVA